ncbi:MAG: autotransporter-associated beta strand repeat-containing protein [Prevotella sp.]|nr:autotransporter-associated beta strand repeat-containing protein [Prevotella sp.]
MKRNQLMVMAVVCLMTATPFEVWAQRIQQALGRGVVAAKGSSGMLVSWRKLAQDPENAHYNVYVNGARLNNSPLSETNFHTTTGRIPNGAKVTVSLVVNGVEGEQSQPFTYKTQAWNNLVYRIDFEKKILNPNEYKAKYAWPADLDGDGEYEWIVDRLSTIDISERSHKLQAYKNDGTCLWTLDIGPNIDIDAGQNDMVLAYDINCDGKSEVLIKSSDGTRFWDAEAGTFGKYVFGKESADIDGDGIIDYAKQTQRNPPFYISVIDGMTGAEITSAELDYSKVHDGVDSYGRTNRSSYRSDDSYREYSTMGGHFGICYFDGIHPSLAMECMVRTTDGNHHNYVFSFDYDWDNGTPQNWHHSYTWSRNDKSPWPAEFHMVRVCDVDGDGIDELVPGGYSVNSRKGMVNSAGIGHGDRFRLSDIDPDRPGLECFAIQQTALLGQVLYDAATGKHIKEWYLPSVYDVGRGECMDVDDSHKGWEIYSLVDRNILWDCKGNVIRSGQETAYPFEGIWWDGTLQREILGSPGGSGWGSNVMIMKFDGTRLIQQSSESSWAVHAGWAVRPLFVGDIMGDWREEVALMIQNDDSSTGMAIYSTDISTPYSMYCLQEDPHYRLDCTTRGYYQSPNPGFYLGGGMPMPQLPPCMVTDMVMTGSEWSVGSTDFKNYQRTESVAYSDGKSVLFDLYTPSVVTVSGNVTPSVVYAMPVKGQATTLDGAGSLIGNMDLWKGQQGTLILDAKALYTGKTVISEGILQSDNDLVSTTIDLRARGTLAGNPRVGKIVFEGALNYEGCRLMPGNEGAKFGVMTFTQGLQVEQPIYMEMDLQTEGAVNHDVIHVDGDLTLTNPVTINVKTTDQTLQPGEYPFIEYTGAFVGKEEDISVMGLAGLSYQIKAGDGKVCLVINAQRAPSTDVVWTGAESDEWDYQSENFRIGETSTEFVATDEVQFTDEGQNTTININELLPVNGVLVSADKNNYVFNGTDGGFSGIGGLTKEGTARLTINNTKSTYTGPTIINNGTLAIKEIADGGKPSSIGAASTAASNWQLGKATLIINNNNGSTDRRLTLTDSATIQIPTSSVSLKGRIEGKGSLTKIGSGQLTISYEGSNTWSGGTILNAGTLAMGAWNTTFGTTNSSIIANGGTIVIFDNNSTSAVPVFANRLTIPTNKTVTMRGGSRCKIQGTLLGAGSLSVNFPYVRGDFSMNTANFEGKLTVTGNQCRFVSATDLSKATLELGSGVYVAHFTSQSGNETNLTTKVGSLVSTATDATLSTGTWNVGYLGHDDTFACKFTGTLNKYGSGTLTLTGASSGALNIYEGKVLANCTSASTTTGTTTVRNGGTLAGTGLLQSVTVQEGGVLGVGRFALTLGTMTLKGSLTVQRGGILNIKVRRSAAAIRNDAFRVEGKVTLTNPVFQVDYMGTDILQEGDELQIVNAESTITVNGTPSFIPERPAEGLLWDTSRLASEGIISVMADPTGIKWQKMDGVPQEVYDLNGRKLEKNEHKGVYIVNGRKIRK